MAGEVSGVASFPDLPDTLQAALRIERRTAPGPMFTLEASLEVPPGVTILYGPSGSGKSTLLAGIAGFESPSCGFVRCGAETLFDADRGINVPANRRHIACVFQEPALFPHLTVAQNVGYGLFRLPARERDERVESMLAALHIADLHSRRPREISGGEAQRAALARALVTSPRALLFDEPLTGLESDLKQKLMEDLRLLFEAQQIPVVYVTHDREEAAAMGERAILLDCGRITAQGDLSSVFAGGR